MATVGVGGNSQQADSQPKSVGLVWRLAATWHLVCINHINHAILHCSVLWSIRSYRIIIIMIIIISSNANCCKASYQWTIGKILAAISTCVASRAK